ncbi:3-oxoacyl-ACP reductase FabG [Bacillus sp. FJAT-44742]|uniref:3-oxoacyl-ACP reductase FabG n=1 Tax=Bacillus sp. FJAT-44742 TaxID=2014005 RepID=UPI000C23C5DD|nr:3-oxoacyl-ACP reductase FabG [Bacillus sp. FJAT-44742]
MSKRFEGRTALITGGSRGIGKAIAKQLAEEGANIALLDVNEEALNEAKKYFENSDLKVITMQANVVSSQDVQSAVDEAVEAFGSLDILVNNAGIIRDNLLFKMSEDDWEQVIDVHLKGSFNAARSVQKYMVDQKFGRIINISSTSALGNRGQANYSTVKAGLQGFTKTLALELGKFGITCNAVAPGFIETEMTKATAERVGIPFEQFIEARANEIPVKRSGQPEDIANAVAFFADEKSSFVNGQVIYVAGGPKA